MSHSSSHTNRCALKALVITAPGINCDLELCEAFTLAGCDVTSELLTRLSRAPS